MMALKKNTSRASERERAREREREKAYLATRPDSSPTVVGSGVWIRFRKILFGGGVASLGLFRHPCLCRDPSLPTTPHVGFGLCGLCGPALGGDTIVTPRDEQAGFVSSAQTLASNTTL